MLIFVAALLAAIATFLSGAGLHSGSWIDWQTFLCASVVFLALHLGGVGRSWGPVRQAPPVA
jgi:hypothetical protein